MSEHENRLRMMIDPAQQTWDLSPNDVAAIAWALDQIKHTGEHHAQHEAESNDDCGGRDLHGHRLCGQRP